MSAVGGGEGLDSAPATGSRSKSPGPDLVVLLSVLLLAAAPVVITVRLTGPLRGPDTFWHLALGRHLLATWDFGPTDPLSPLSRLPWVYNQWLPEVVASLAEDVAGLAGVVWLTAATRLAIIAALWYSCRRRAGTLPALAAAMAAAASGSTGWDARPQLIGILLFVVAASAALSSVDDGRIRWWLVPLTWVWAMCHGTWVVAVVMFGLVALAGLADRSTDSRRRHLTRFALALAMAVAASVTPVGPRLYTTLGGIGAINQFIQEWQPLSLRDPILAVTMICIGLVVVCWVRGVLPSPSWGRLALVAFALGNALMYGRTVALAAAIMAPMVAEALQRLVPRRGRGWGRREAAALGAGIVVSLAYGAVVFPKADAEPGDAPTAMSATLAALPPQIVFNDQGVAGWLYWTHPNLTPVIDTRWEVYGAEAAKAYLEVDQVAGGWEESFDRTKANIALLKEGSPLAAALQTQRHWTVRSRDAGLVLLQRP